MIIRLKWNQGFEFDMSGGFSGGTNKLDIIENIKNSYREKYNQMNVLQTYDFFRNSLVFAHCCLTRDSNSAGVTGRPDAKSLLPSTNLTSENLKKVIKQLTVAIQ